MDNLSSCSLREQLTAMFPTQPDTVKGLIEQYALLVAVNPSWRIGVFISLIKAKAIVLLSLLHWGGFFS
jgi:hypothetical protein